MEFGWELTVLSVQQLRKQLSLWNIFNVPSYWTFRKYLGRLLFTQYLSEQVLIMGQPWPISTLLILILPWSDVPGESLSMVGSCSELMIRAISESDPIGYIRWWSGKLDHDFHHNTTLPFLQLDVTYCHPIYLCTRGILSCIICWYMNK